MSEANIAGALDAVGPTLIGLAGLIGVLVQNGSTHRKVDQVQAQMKPNGGSSVRDALNRIEARLDVVHRSQVATAERLDRHEADCG